MSKKYGGKNTLVAAIMANAYATSLKSRDDEVARRSNIKINHTAYDDIKPKPKQKSLKKSMRSKTGSTEFDIKSIINLHHERKSKSKPKAKRHTNNNNNNNNIRISRSLSPRLFKNSKKSNTKKQSKPKKQLKPKSKPKSKTKSKSKTRIKPNLKSKSCTKSSSLYHLSAPSLQSIHSDDEADEFDDDLSPNQRKAKLRSVLEDIFGESDEDEFETETEHKLKYESHNFTLSIQDDIGSFSMNLGFVLQFSPFTHFHIGFNDKKKRKTIGKSAFNCAYAIADDINSYSFATQNIKQVENNEIYAKYVSEFGEPKKPKYLMSFAKQKGKQMSLSDAIAFVENTATNSLDRALSDLIDAEEEAIEEDNKMMQLYERQMNDGIILTGLMDDDYDETATINPINPPVAKISNLQMSNTLLSATPEPNSSCNESYQENENRKYKSKRKKHKRGSNFNLLINMNDNNNINTQNTYFVHPQLDKMRNCDFMTKKKRKKRKKQRRSQSQPSKVIQDLMNEMDSSFDIDLDKIVQKTEPIVAKRDLSAFDDDKFDTNYMKTQTVNKQSIKQKQSVSKPNTPKNSRQKKKISAHQRSHSTDQNPKNRTSALKLNEFQIKRTKSVNKMSKLKSKKKVHKLDFNLYGIEIRPNRRYRLMDGRIGIAKFKGATVFGRGCETYIGLLIEYGDGVHDGSVSGKSYFRCKQGKGDIVRPHQIIQDLGRFTNPITQQLIDEGYELIIESKQRLKEYLKVNKLKLPKKAIPSS